MEWIIITWILGFGLAAISLYLNHQHRTKGEPQSMPLWGATILAAFVMFAPGVFASIARGIVLGILQVPHHITLPSLDSAPSPLLVGTFLLSSVLAVGFFYKLNQLAKKDGKSLYDYIMDVKPSDEEVKSHDVANELNETTREVYRDQRETQYIERDPQSGSSEQDPDTIQR